MSRLLPFRRSTRHWLAFAVWLVTCIVLFSLLDGRTRGLVVNSFRLAACTAAATLPAGLVLATVLTKLDIPGRRIAWVLLISGLFLPLYLIATAWESALGLQGSVASWFPLASDPVWARYGAAVFIHGVALLPSVTLIIAAGLAAVERVLEEDALLCGSASSVLVRVTSRRSLASLFAALIWVFVVCLGEMTVTDLFQIRTFAEEIYVQTAGAVGSLVGPGTETTDAVEFSRPSFTLAVLLIAVVLLPAILWCLGLVHRWQRSPGQRRWTVTPRAGRRSIAAAVLLLFLVALFGLPPLSLFYHAGLFTESSGDGYVAHWSLWKGFTMIARAPVTHAEEILRTLLVAAAAATMATILAAALGVWATYRAEGKVTSAILAAALAATPGPLIGLWTIHLLNQPPDSALSFLSALYDEDDFGFAPWFVQTLRILPFAVLMAVPAMMGTPRALLEAASLDGARLGRQVLHVFMPVHWRSLLLAWLVALVLAIGELPATVLVYPPGVTPLSVRIFQLVHYGVDDQLAGLVLFVWLAVLLVSGVILALAARSARRQV